MQAQQTRNTTEAINYTQSLAAVQTLLKAGLGAIAYLRNLLPEDNFVSSHFTAAKTESDQSFELESSQESSYMRSGNGFSIMTLARGYTDEADRLLNYLEYGIFDALEKRYLRSFIFAVYLDNSDPNNILEAYTFNFKYYTIPGSDVTIPIMSLGETLKKMSLNGKGRDDPVARAIRNGKTPTLREVKMSVKTLLKTLITAMQKMELLPRRRFATFKIFYTDDTPLDYEPPHFQAGDVEKDKWYFMTHDLDEVPDRYNIGKLNTGHHCVNITVASITPYLPYNEAFGETVAHAGLMTLTPLQEVDLSKKQAEALIEDANKRIVVWAADDNVEAELDAEGVDDPDYIRLEDGTYMPIDATPVPIGIRAHEGAIKALPTQASTEEAQYEGASVKMPTRLQEMAVEPVFVRGEIAETQPLFTTPENKVSNLIGLPSPQDKPMSSSFSSQISTPLNRTRAMTPEFINSDFSGGGDVGMLDLETQPLEKSGVSIESINSFEPNRFVESIVTTSPTVIDDEVDDNGLDCECGIEIEDDALFCEGRCKKWFHVWCMGYHTVKDPRIPAKFTCFDCRARSDVNWDFIQLDIYPAMLQRFKALTVFRRAIKVAEKMKSFGSSEFSKAFGSNVMEGTQMIKRLEEEGFIMKETVLLDSMGAHTTSRSKAKTKYTSTRPRRNLQKARYVFNFSIQSKDQYKDYFKPNYRETETHILGIIEMLKSDTGTQTQEETQQQAGYQNGNPKRGSGNSENGRPLKKVKISVTAGVDLAE